MADGNVLKLYGSVGQSFWDEEFFTARQVSDWLAGRVGAVTVQINSGGGIAAEGLAIYSALKDHPGEVHVVIDAVAYSAASLIAMAGDTITFRLGATMMIHDPASMLTEGRGTEADHLSLATQLRVLSDAFADVYAARAGISRDVARQIMRDETVLDGAMALDMGFATAVEAAVTPAAAPARAAVFDYRLYAHAPGALRARSEGLGESAGRQAVLAMVAGATGKQEREPLMADQTKTAAEDTAAEDDAAQTAAKIGDDTGDAPVEGQATVTASAERLRAARITDIVMMAGMESAMASQLIKDGVSVEGAVAAVLDKRKEAQMKDDKTAGQPARIIADGRDRFIAGASLALMAKAGLKGGERNEFSSLSLSELARDALARNGVRGGFDDKREMVGRAFTMAGAHGTSDFATILENIQGKAALQGWEAAEETFEAWTRKGSLSDFKSTKRVGVGLFDALPAIAESGEYTYGTVSDRGEPIALATYGKVIRITRQAIINDDLSLLGDLPRKMGMAAKRTVGNLVYAILTGNPTMADGVALFHTATHANLLGSGTALSVASLGAAWAAMRIQKESATGPALNITPAYLIVPAALAMTARQILTSTVDPTASKGHANNPVQNLTQLVVDARLDAASATAWYLAASPGAFDTIEVAYLDGNDTPFLEQQTPWTTDGVEMKVRIDAAAAPLDHRTMYKNPGA
jgi:ATP-dependent protease ClpP protease subunit